MLAYKKKIVATQFRNKVDVSLTRLFVSATVHLSVQCRCVGNSHVSPKIKVRYKQNY